LEKAAFGARFHKVDLHFHTPGSSDARGDDKYDYNPYKDQYKAPRGQQVKVGEIRADLLKKARELADKIVERFVEENLSLVAISDHNSIATIWSDIEDDGIMDLMAPTWYEIIDDVAEKINNKEGKKKLTILPSVEISCTGIHMLAIFPPTHPRRAAHFVICDLLSEIGFSIDEWGKNPKVGKRSVIDAVNLIRQKGGIPIPAHIDGSDQALLDLYKLDSVAMKNVFYNPQLSAVEVVKPSRFTRKKSELKTTLKIWIDSLRTKKGLGSIAYFQGSDAHDLPTIGKRFTYIKMVSPSFEGLKNSINTPSTRVRFSDGYKSAENGLFVYGLDIKGKSKMFFRFNRHLNCVIGKKETGKTLVFQLMQRAVKPGISGPVGEIKLFVEKVVNSKSSYYCFSRNGGHDIKLYSINKDAGSAKEIDIAQIEKLSIGVNFYDPQRIDEIISSRDKLNGFLIKHFEVKTKKEINEFNKMFATTKFLEKGEEPLLHIEKQQGGLKLSLNINWGKNKPKYVEFSRMNNSMKRVVMLMMIIQNNQFGPVIIDAPEDYLDNEDVVKYLLPMIRKNKDIRQIIFFTGNPVLAVNSDPDNYIVLTSKSKKQSKAIPGFSIDDPDKKELVINLMEGGSSSFKGRTIRYSL
jgi:hypothetical protein